MPTLRSMPWAFDGELRIPGPDVSPRELAGIAVAVCGNVLISFALNLQKLAHRRLELERQRVQPFAHTGYEDDILEHDEGSETPETRRDRAGDMRAQRMFDESSTATRVNSDEYIAASSSEGVPLLASAARDYGSTPNAVLSLEPDSNGGFRRLLPLKVLFRRKSKPPLNDMPDVVLIPPTPDPARDASPDSESLPSPVDDTSTEQEEPDEGQESDYLKSKLWWLGFLLMNVGEIGNFLAYAFAPASVVAPLGTFALIANCVFAPLLLHERFRKRDMLGIACAIIGAVTVVLASDSSSIILDPPGLIHAICQPPFLAFTAIYIVLGVFLSAVSRSDQGRRWVWVDVGLCAIFGGFTVLATKGVSTLLTTEGGKVFTEWILYPLIIILVGTGVGQIRHLNRALMRFDSKLVVPSQFVLFNLSAIVGSAILYGDFRRVSFHQMVTFLYGCAATFLGVWLIAWRPASAGSSPAESAAREDGEPALPATNGREGHSASLPILRHKRSVVELIGFSPAQRLLLLNSSPPREMNMHVLRDPESPASEARRRVVSWAEPVQGDGQEWEERRRRFSVATTASGGSRSNSTSNRGENGAGHRSNTD